MGVNMARISANLPARSEQQSAYVLRPFHVDALLTRAALVTERMATNRKRYATAFGISKSRTSRHHTGDKHSPASKVLLTLDTLARGEGTTAWPLIAEGIATVLQAEIRIAPTSRLEARLAELIDASHDLGAEKNRRVMHGDHAAAALAEIRESENQLERVAIRRELIARRRA